jgi:hypothetical protein
MKNLIKKLKEFDEERRNALRTPEKWDDEAVAKCFVPIAKYVLLNGYFLVNDKYIIDLGAIELYYHEEDGNIKDHIMYHTNEHPSKSKVYKLNNGFPYFKIGSFNLHQSGIDVTFENDANKDDKYRASFLIRSYRVLESEKDLNNMTIPFDNCSTHIFDDMFYEGISYDAGNKTTIEWIEFHKIGSYNEKGCPRVNVSKYRLNNKNKYEKDDRIYDSDKIITKEDFEVAKKDADASNSYPKYFKYGTGKYYKQDMKLWQFKRNNIIEK